MQAGSRSFSDLADAGDRAAGADAADERVDLPAGVAPDLLGGRPPVDLGVRGVVELLRHVGVVVLPAISRARSTASPIPPIDGVSRTIAP